jgi:putative DNA primase/helicase
MTAELIARGLRKGRRSGRGFVACCVAHDDHNPSLSIIDGDAGSVRVKCFAGCAQKRVIEGLRRLGLWEEPSVRVRRTSRTCVVAEYDYHSSDGSVVFQVCRTEPKGFFQRIPDGRGGWSNRGLRDQDRVLFNLPPVLSNRIIFLVEGERDVLTLAEFGFVGTCEAGGANAPWLPQYTTALQGRGREVILIPDRDKPGYARVKRIARALLGKVDRLVYLELEDGKDLTEWFSRGHSEVELINLLDGGEVSH